MQQFTKLPGVGMKSAQRLAFFMLSLPQTEVDKFAEVMTYTRKNIRYCESCYNISFQNRCDICSDPSRDGSQLCIVAEPKDIMAFERTRTFKGVYHVLGGLISPIDGIHPDILRIEELKDRCQETAFKEVILAINPTIEGDATSLYLTEILSRFKCPITKLAYGLPAGSDIDYADEMTLQKALMGRRLVTEKLALF